MIRAALTALATVLATIAHATGTWAADAPGASRPVIAPPADWVLPAEIPKPPAKTEGASLVELLLDQQVHLIPGGSAQYRGSVTRIATAQGLDAAALQLNWDPSLEVLTIHRYRIVRDGRMIDLLGDGSRMQVVRREKNLENATLDGELTASQQPEDVRVGDVIDLAYTITRRDPATGGRAEGFYGPQDGAAYGRYRLRVTWPDTRTVHWRAMPGAVQPRQTSANGQTELLADLIDVVTKRPPSHAPARFDMVNLVDLSEFADWPTVSRTYSALFASAATIAPGSPLQAEIARIAATSPDPVRRAELALTLTQEQVRYLFVGIDDGGFVPAPADQTWARRYGDCKGKTALLLALLSGLGIPARAVLVNTENGDATAHRLATMGGFDHVLVAATIAGKDYWLDGTREGDAHLARLQPPAYVVGLPATATGSDLIALMPPDPRAPQTDTSLTLDSSAGIEAPALATAEMRFHGEEAATIRMKYAGLDSDDLTRDLRKLWRDTYDFVTPEMVSASADEATGDYVVAMRGKAKMDWYSSGTSRWYELDRARLGWKIETARDGELNADAPYGFTWPNWWANHETVILPDGGKGFTLQSHDVDQTVGGLFAFHRKVTLHNGVVTMDNDTHALKPELPAAEAETTHATMQALAADGVFIHLPIDYFHTPADFAALAGDRKALALAHVQNGLVLLDRNQDVAAITEGQAALAIDPAMITAHGVLALALARTGHDDDQAMVEVDRVMAPKAGDPTGPQLLALNARGTVLQHRKDLPGAIAAYDQVLKVQQTNVIALIDRGNAHLQLNHGALALADYDAVLALSPGLRLAGARAEALVMVGRRDDALEQADVALGRNPADRFTRRLRARVREQTGDMAGAMADAEYLIAHAPTALDYCTHARLLPVTNGEAREADIAAALKLDPKSQAAWYLRAQDAIDAGRLDQGQAAVDAIARLKPDSLALAGLRLDLLAKRGQAAAALKLAGETISQHPANPTALNLVCWFKATRNVALDTAVADCDAALKLSADNPAFLDSRGLARLRGGDSKGAIADYSAALRKSPEMVGSLYGRGIAYARLGDRNRALADLYHARSNRPEIDTIWAGYGVNPPSGF